MILPDQVEERARRASAGRSLMSEEVLVPGDRPGQAAVQVEEGLPAEFWRALAALRYWWMISLDASFRTSGSRSLPIFRSIAHQVEDGHLDLVREVECLAPKLGAGGQRLGEEHVRGGAVLDVEVVADELPSERITGRWPRSTERIVPGTIRFQFRSPPP